MTADRRNISANELNQSVSNLNASGIEMLSRQPLDNVNEKFAGQISLSSSVGSLTRVCQSSSQHLAILVQPPERFAVRINLSSSALRQVGEFENVDWPIWNWCVRAVKAGFEFQLEASEETLEESDFPTLAPSHPGRRQSWLYEELCNVQIKLLANPIQSKSDATALRAGILQINDYLDESHNNSQSVEGRGRNNAGDYWHAIMHRREPDYWNSKYWFRRVGSQSLFADLADRVATILESCDSSQAQSWQLQLGAPDSWDSMVFVDLCEHCANSSDASLVAASQAIQFEEMLLLLESTREDAVS